MNIVCSLCIITVITISIVIVITIVIVIIIVRNASSAKQSGDLDRAQVLYYSIVVR